MERRNEILRELDEANRQIFARRRAVWHDRQAECGLAGELQYTREVAEAALRKLDYEMIGENGVTRVLDLRDPRQVLQAIAWWEQQRAIVEDQAGIHMERRDELIREVMAVEPALPRDDIARAARVKKARLYQIRDGRR